MKNYTRVKSVPEAMMKYRQMGWSVIPVGMDKKPLLKWKEFQDRIISESELFDWYSKYPNCQIGIVTGKLSNLVVIDVEAGGDISPYPKTLMVKTGGGGHHLYYQHPGKAIKTDARIAELTDIRGDGGFVVAPPSVSEKGPYSWILLDEDKEFDLSTLPVFPVELYEQLTAPKNDNSTANQAPIPVGMRNEAAAKRAGELLAAQNPEHWETIVWPQLLHWNTTALAEALGEDELRKVFASITERRRAELSSRNNAELVFKPFTLSDLYKENFPPIEWVAKNLIPLGCLGAITGESNSYKSFLTLVLANAVATGSPYLGHFKTDFGKVLIIDEENNRRIIEKRFRDMGVEANDHIVFLSQTGLQIDREAHQESILRFVNELKPRLIIMDSLVRLHGLDENSANEMRHVMKALGRLVAEDRTVIFIHHHKKDQGYSRKVGSSSLRGSTDIFAALDFHLAIERKSDDVVVRMLKLRVQEEAKPFRVNHGLNEKAHFTFTYQGEDNSREEQLREVKESILALVTGVEGEVSKQDVLEELQTGIHLTDEALRQMVDDGTLSLRRGARNKYLYSLSDDRPEPDKELTTEAGQADLPQTNVSRVATQDELNEIPF